MKRLFSIMIMVLSVAFLLSACGGGGGGGGGTNPNPTYTVTYNGNGNTGGSVPIDTTNYEQGQTVTVLGNTGNLVKAGYAFSGWNTMANGTGTNYTQGQPCTMGAANVTLYAIWTANPTYTVTYNGNGSTGGSVPSDTTNYQQGQIVTVLGNTGNLVKTGYTFAGWNTQADGSGTTYTQSQTFTMGAANVTLYAKWTAAPTYTVTYNGNGNTSGSVPSDTTNYQQGQTVTVLGNTGNLVKTGYTLAGWNTQANGSGTTYTQAQTFTMGAANVTLYAKWTAAPTYTVTYNGNGNTGGSVPIDSTNYEQGQTVTVLGNTGNLVKTGYTFAGWNTQADGSGTTYTQSQTFMMGSANVTLHAKWTAAPTYTVTYVGNSNTGGSVPIDTANYQQGQTVTVLGNTGNLAKTGYTFSGWNTAANGTGTAYSQGSTFIMGSASVTLYAQWTQNPTYTVTYDGNGGVGSVPSDTTNYQQGQIVTVLGNTGNLVKTGYTFAGWNTQADGGGTNYTQAQTFTMGAANVILYARWIIPIIPVPDTGQTTCYDLTRGGTISCTGTGQDGAYTINPPSYTDNRDGTITDNVTGLTWQKCSMGQSGLDCAAGSAATYDWTTAGTTCGSLSLAGTGWRLPTDYELTTIVDFGTINPAINTAYFPNTQSSLYWSSTTYADFPSGAWYVSFLNGDTYFDSVYLKTSIFYVRCVRPTAAFAGSFKDNVNGTVTDLTTNLMWQQCSAGYTTTSTKCDTPSGTVYYPWDNAISYCEALSLGGFTDWRLPNVKELKSIVDMTRSNPAINIIFFPNTLSHEYWTSTTYAAQTSLAWIVYFYDGYTNGYVYSKANIHFVRCVRGQ